MLTEAGLRVETDMPRSIDYDTQQRTNYRWMICALLFVVTTINYLDRQTLATLKPLLQTKLTFDEAAYGWMNFAFTAGYAIMYTFAGRFIDWMGTRKGLAIAVVVWSLACMAQDADQGSTKKAKIPWTILLRQRQAWPFLIGKLPTDPVWWFFLFWMPSYLHDIRHWSLMASATSLLIPYTAASVGSIFG